MKKFKLLPIVAFALLLGSCKKDKLSIEEPIQTSSILKKSDVDQVKYAETNLLKVANGLAKLAQNEEFVNFVHSKAAKKFGGEYQVLIETLKKEPKWATLLNTPEINEGLNAFKNLDGQYFFPQIFIPKMQHDEEENSSRGNNLDGSNSDISFVVFGGELPTDITTYPGGNYPNLKLGANNTLINSGVANEQYSEDNEVWVISLNEVTAGLLAPPIGNCFDPSDPECYPTGGGGGSGGGGSSSGVDTDPAELSRSYHPEMNTNNPVNCKIQNMIVREHKESWVAGGSEIAIRSLLNTINGRILGDINLGFDQYYSTLGTTSFLGKGIKFFTRKKIKNGTVEDVNFTLQTGWPTNIITTGPVFYDFVIFEKDSWPTGVQTLRREGNYFQDYSTNLPSSFYGQSYRSSDIFYDINRITCYNSAVSPSGTSPLNLLAPSFTSGNTSTNFYISSRNGLDNSISYNSVGF